MTGGAGRLLWNRDGYLRPLHRLLEAESHLRLEITSANGLGAGAPAATEIMNTPRSLSIRVSVRTVRRTTRLWGV